LTAFAAGWRIRKSKRGIAQLVAYLVWDQRVASSNLATPTNKSLPQNAVGFVFFVATKACFQEQKKKIKTKVNEVSDRLLFAVKPNPRSRTCIAGE
jgi:hypothetical protein